MAKEEFGSNAKRKKLTVRLQGSVYSELVDFCQSQPVEPTHNAVVEKALTLFFETNRKRFRRA